MKQQLVALHFITRTLRGDRQIDTDVLRTEIRAGQPPWEAVVSLANDHLLTPALWVALNTRGLADDLPEDLYQYLQELHKLSRERNRHLRLQLLEAARELNAAGIVPVLLKGAKHLVTTIYADPGVRIMSDIDLLVSRTDITPAYKALQQLGYRPVEDVHGDYHDEHHHCAPLFREGDYGTLELHRGLAENPYAAILPMELALTGLEPLEVEEVRMTALSTTHRILHTIIHSQLADHFHDNGIIPLRSLHEMATEYSAANVNVDWLTIKRQMEQHKRGRVLDAYLFMAHKLFAMSYPADTDPTLAGRLYCRRCRAQLGWRWAQQWGMRLGRYSPDTMNERYNCGSGWLAVNRSRIRQLAGRISILINYPAASGRGIRP